MAFGNYDVSAISGTKKSIEEGIGTGGGYVAYQQPHTGNIFDTDQNRKYVDLSGVSAFCSQQA